MIERGSVMAPAAGKAMAFHNLLESVKVVKLPAYKAWHFAEFP